MIKIWLFGSLTVAAGDDERQQLAVAGRSASLLAYLALGRGCYFSRSDLLGSLWPERSGASTPGSFNTALWRLRRLIEPPPHKHGDVIVCDRRGAIGLNGSAQLWLDVEEFQHAIASGLSKPPERLTDEDIAGLEHGVALYKSDILMDMTDDWALREREKYRRDYLNALGRLIQIATIRRQYAEGIRHAQAILDHDALREDVHRELMQLFVLNGQRAQALRQFEHCRELLRRELAIQPMRETMALYQKIADSAIGGSVESVVSMPMPVPGIGAGESGARQMIDSARGYLAHADEQLQLSLRFLV
ncbi:AfsR/SARP family transcriptional regulator [Luteimonas panaciterrae]|uniref:AfsR/SARP family transcriptional regulator n=1 Tax=Luteimonas panaciterrae TaxID=363885 RepID=UPI001CFB401D|nr:BTAD domain-containing putative transcriptional regulator [Luteimonas panaciterrae]